MSDLKVDQNGIVTFKLSNNGGTASLANADQFSISSSNSPSNTKATPAVPANSSIVVGDGQAGGSVSVAAIVNKMKPNESTTFSVQLQSNQATVRFPFTKAATGMSSLTVSSASINLVTKDLTFVLTNKGSGVDHGADTYLVTSDPQIPGDIARVATPAMTRNMVLTIEVKGSGAKLASYHRESRLRSNSTTQVQLPLTLYLICHHRCYVLAIITLGVHEINFDAYKSL